MAALTHFSGNCKACSTTDEALSRPMEQSKPWESETSSPDKANMAMVS